MACVAFDRDGRLDLEIAEAMAGVLEHREAFVGSVRNRGDQRAHMTVGHVEQLVDAGVDGRFAIFVEHGDQVAFTDLAGADQAR